MSRLIQELTHDHKGMLAMLEEVRAMGTSSPEARKKLVSMKSALLAHLKKEDDYLYPELEKKALTDRTLQITLDVMAKNMEQVSTDALAFFEKYADGQGGVGFAQDFGKLYMMFKMRMQKEESMLYAKIENA